MFRYIESETLELKEKYTDNIVREVVSFLNSSGGTIYIGVTDDGTVKGVAKPDEVLRKISDCITDQIEPSPQGEIHSNILNEDGNVIVVVEVKKGIKPLYCIRKYGFSSKGCPVRIGTTCKDMSSEEILFRYKTQFTNEDYMLLAPAKYGPLSFEMMKILLTGRGYHINDASFESNFNLRRQDGTYNLLAEILSDQNMMNLIFVKFSGKDKTAISQRSDYGGQSLLLGYQKMKARLSAENICRTDTSVRPRVDEFLYDDDAISEALVNMLVHNDWTITEPLISFYSDRVVFTSHGGLPHGLTQEDFFKGISQPRNVGLMRVFLNLGIVEHTGHGVPLIVEKYGREVFNIQSSYINVSIPFNEKVMALVPQFGTTSGTSANVNELELDPFLTDTQRAVLLELVRRPKATYNGLATEIGVSRRTVSRAIAALVDMEYIERVGNNISGFWKIIR